MRRLCSRGRRFQGAEDGVGNLHGFGSGGGGREDGICDDCCSRRSERSELLIETKGRDFGGFRVDYE